MRSGDMGSAHQPRDLHSGFTLLEMLVVMALVGLLLSLALPRYFSSIKHSKETVLVHNLQAMRAAIDRFSADKGRFPESLEELVIQRYLRKVPVDPITEKDNTWITVLPEQVEDGGVIDVRSGAPGVDSAGMPYEQL